VDVVDPTEQLAMDLHSAAIHLLRRVRQTDATLGITPSRLSALSVLVFGGPRTLSQLAEAEMVAGPTMSKIVAALERDGLVQREPHASDRRAVKLSATATGRKLLLRGRRRRVEHLVGDLEALSAADQAVLRKATAILQRLEHRRPPMPYADATVR
jgi:DNA-binding MarR family transcriptional regulator